MNKTMRHFGDGSLQTRDGRMLVRDVRDTVLNGEFRITPDTRILPEPAPPAPNLGVLYDGTGGIPKQADVEVIFNSFTKALEPLGPADIAKIKALMLKYSGVPSGPTNAVGITANDAARRGVDAIDSINAKNKAFWDAKNLEQRQAIVGR
jgi:hypothetical protein